MEEFVPRNGFGGYDVKVTRRGDSWIIEGSKADFFGLTKLGWSHFLDLAKRDGHEKMKALLLNNGFKLS